MSATTTKRTVRPALAVGAIRWTEHTRNHYSAWLGGLTGLHIEVVRSPRWRSLHVKPWRIVIGGNSFGHNERFDHVNDAIHAAEVAALRLIRQLAVDAGLVTEDTER